MHSESFPKYNIVTPLPTTRDPITGVAKGGFLGNRYFMAEVQPLKAKANNGTQLLQEAQSAHPMTLGSSGHINHGNLNGVLTMGRAQQIWCRKDSKNYYRGRDQEQGLFIHVREIRDLDYARRNAVEKKGIVDPSKLHPLPVGFG